MRRRRCGTRLSVQLVDVAPGDHDLAVGGLEVADQELDQGRLAAAGRADDEDELAALDAERDALDADVAAGIDLRDVAKLDDRRLAGAPRRALRTLFGVARGVLAPLAAPRDSACAVSSQDRYLEGSVPRSVGFLLLPRCSSCEGRSLQEGWRGRKGARLNVLDGGDQQVADDPPEALRQRRVAQLGATTNAAVGIVLAWGVSSTSSNASTAWLYPSITETWLPLDRARSVCISSTERVRRWREATARARRAGAWACPQRTSRDDGSPSDDRRTSHMSEAADRNPDPVEEAIDRFLRSSFP